MAGLMPSATRQMCWWLGGEHGCVTVSVSSTEPLLPKWPACPGPSHNEKAGFLEVYNFPFITEHSKADTQTSILGRFQQTL